MIRTFLESILRKWVLLVINTLFVCQFRLSFFLRRMGVSSLCAADGKFPRRRGFSPCVVLLLLFCGGDDLFLPSSITGPLPPELLFGNAIGPLSRFYLAGSMRKELSSWLPPLWDVVTLPPACPPPFESTLSLSPPLGRMRTLCLTEGFF